MDKECTKCKLIKRREDFHRNRNKPSGLHDQCKKCRKEFSKRNSERLAEKDREFALRRKFGITTEDYDLMLATQDYSCAICRRHQDLLERRLAVDHCHETGNVRGLLCSNCNTGIGNLRDSIDLLYSGIEYLSRYST